MHIKAGVLELSVQRNVLSGRGGARNDELLTKSCPAGGCLAEVPVIQSPKERQNESVTVVVVLAVAPRGP